MSFVANEEPRSKRRRLSPPSTTLPAIHNVSQLQDLLHFKQSVDPSVKQGINHFKDFLTSITRNEDVAEQSHQLKILRAYCDGQAAPSKDQVSFPDLLSTWSFAAQSENDALSSAVPAALAQFFRTISGFLEFREFGLSLCHGLLARDQLRLFDRGLGAPRSKEHLISPCLRLLTEITSFDGGALAGNVFARRDMLYKRVDNLLGFVRSHHEVEDLITRRKPSVRRMALRFVLANFKFLPDGASKAELLVHGKTLHSCVRHLSSDGDDIVVEFLHAIDRIIEDEGIPRPSKIRFLNSGNLSALAALYDYMKGQEDDTSTNAIKAVRQSVHTMLIKVCTTRKGIMQNQSGWYPTGADPESMTVQADCIDLGLESPTYFDDYESSVPVSNGILSTFLQQLKPETDTLQAALVLKIFQAAPELVADYFSKKTRFYTPPKDDPAWRSHFAFLFSVVQLPVPRYCGWRDHLPSSPPPLSVVIESILPRPFDQATIARCFNMKEEIMILSAARLMSVALQKLELVLQLFKTAVTKSSTWSQASSRLADHFSRRSPPLKDIVLALHRTSKENDLVRNALIECLATFYKVLPESAAGSSFDIGTNLLEVLQQLNSDDPNTSDRESALEKLPHLVTIAELSPATKWWIKPESSTLSLVAHLLKVCTSAQETEARSQIQRTTRRLLEKQGVVELETQGFQALHASLVSTKKWSPTQSTFVFVDNCMSRTTKSPVKYLDSIEHTQQEVSDNKPLSLLASSIVEQWPFVLKKDDVNDAKNIAEWIARFYVALDAAGENHRVMLQFQQDVLKVADGKVHKAFEKALEKQRKKPVTIPRPDDELTSPEHADVEMADVQPKPQKKTIVLEEVFGTPSESPESLKGLDRWDNSDWESDIQHGRLVRLLQCTSSPEEEIRRSTFQILQIIMHAINSSSYPEREQLFLMLGELFETIKVFGLDQPLPSVVAELACHLVKILADPSDKMYGKANRFLMRGPSWEIPRLIPYWVDKILLSEPEDDEGRHLEVERLLDILINGLRTTQDMELYRKSNVFERVLSFYNSTQSGRQAKRKVLQLVYRATQTGGANVLITRIGVRAWLSIVGQRVYERDTCEALQRALEEKADAVVIARWETSRPILRAKAEPVA